MANFPNCDLSFDVGLSIAWKFSWKKWNCHRLVRKKRLGEESVPKYCWFWKTLKLSFLSRVDLFWLNLLIIDWIFGFLQKSNNLQLLATQSDRKIPSNETIRNCLLYWSYTLSISQFQQYDMTDGVHVILSAGEFVFFQIFSSSCSSTSSLFTFAKLIRMKWKMLFLLGKLNL